MEIQEGINKLEGTIKKHKRIIHNVIYLGGGYAFGMLMGNSGSVNDLNIHASNFIRTSFISTLFPLLDVGFFKSDSPKEFAEEVLYLGIGCTIGQYVRQLF